MAESKVIPERIKLSDSTPSTQAHDDAGAAGSTEEVSRSGHKHAMPSGGVTQTKVQSFTRDISLASGTQVITGVGFEPTGVLFFAAVGQVANLVCFGMDDTSFPSAGGDLVIKSLGAFTADSWGADGASILITSGGVNEYIGRISATSSDGFTISWTRGGSITGTLTVNYMAFR